MRYEERRPRPLGVKVLVALELFFGIMGVVSGLMLMADPSGAFLGFEPGILERIPFNSFFPVGLFLFVVFGILPLVLSFGLWTKNEMFFREISRAGGIHWAWQGAMILEGVLVIWLLVEGYLIGLDYAATYFTVVLGVLIFFALGATAKYYSLDYAGRSA